MAEIEDDFGANVTILVNNASILRDAYYGAAKAGIIGLTRTLALELARYRIRVNAIAPGAVDTEMMRSVPEKVLQHFLSLIPLGRLGQPREIARLVTFSPAR